MEDFLNSMLDRVELNYNSFLRNIVNDMFS